MGKNVTFVTILLESFTGGGGGGGGFLGEA
jgi:hypothetical protein